MQLPHILKRITTPLVGRVPVTISAGPNRGLKWSLASSGNGFRRGTREPERMDHLAALVHPGDVVWDVGAHYGYVTLLLSRLAGSEGLLHAFEPARRSRWYLSRHVAWNRLGNVTVHPYALADYEGESLFGGDDSSQLFALGGGDERVAVRRADSLVGSGACPPPSFVKVDVEGAEVEVLRGLLDVLPPDARLFVATHSAERYEGCRELMDGAGFRCVASSAIEETLGGSGAEVHASRSRRWPGDPDALFVGPEYGRGEEDVRAVRAAGF